MPNSTIENLDNNIPSYTTQSFVNNLPSSTSQSFSYQSETPDNNGNETADSKRQRGLGDKDYISYRMPWLLYFYPNPKSDPNYILLNPEKDKELIDIRKNQTLGLISFATFFGIMYYFWISGALFPALHTMWFFFWRYITLIIFLCFFFIVIAILKGFPYFINKIRYYASLTRKPSLYLNKKKWYTDFSKPLRNFFYGMFTVFFAFATVCWVCILVLVMIPLFAIFATICGLLLGDLNNIYFSFGMAEYEVTELEKKSMKKRIANSLGITGLNQKISDRLSSIKDKMGISEMNEKYGLTDKLSKLKEVTKNPFLQYKLPDKQF